MPITNSCAINAGDIVMITGYGNDKFIVCDGWYTYDNTRREGWYFKSIPEGTIVPDYLIDLDDVTVVTSSSCNCPPIPGGRPPHPAPKNPNVEGAFVTVDTIDERNALCIPYPPDGKIVRVNDVKGEIKYYIWNAEEFRWNDFTFLGDETTEKITEIDSRLKLIEEDIDWVLMDNLVTN